MGLGDAGVLGVPVLGAVVLGVAGSGLVGAAALSGAAGVLDVGSGLLMGSVDDAALVGC